MLGVTGSGKTFGVAKLVERLQRPTLVLAPNKTLAALLYAEFKSFVPRNAVEYFVSALRNVDGRVILYADKRTASIEGAIAEMMAAAKNFDFELAARIRDEVYRLEKFDMELL